MPIVMARRPRSLLVLAPALALIGALALAPRRAVVAPRADRLATFNIEEFPKDQRQIDGAFALIAGLDVDAIAVQEIFDPGAFVVAAHRWLGPDWQFAHADTMPAGGRWPPVHIGVLYDSRRYDAVGSIVHDELRLDGRNKPALEVQLRPRDGGELLRIFVVHLKSGGDGREIQAGRSREGREVVAIAVGGRVEVAHHHDPPGRALLGAHQVGQRDELARATWATEDLACSAFWRRDDDCPTSRLDHVLSWAPPRAVEAHGACATLGCGEHASCPRYRDEVSDHCPITVQF